MLVSHSGIFGIVATLVTAHFTAATALKVIFAALFLREILGKTLLLPLNATFWQSSSMKLQLPTAQTRSFTLLTQIF